MVKKYNPDAKFYGATLSHMREVAFGEKSQRQILEVVEHNKPNSADRIAQAERKRERRLLRNAKYNLQHG